MFLRAQGTLEKESFSHFGNKVCGKFLYAADGFKFGFVMLDSSAAVDLPDLLIAAEKFIKVLPEGALPVPERFAERADSLFEFTQVLVSGVVGILAGAFDFTLVIVSGVVGILAGAFEASADGEVIEGSSEFHRGEFSFGGLGAEVVGIGFFRAAEPCDEIPVSDGENAFADPVLEFGHAQRAHVIFDQDLQDMIFSESAAEFQAAHCAKVPPFRGRGKLRFGPFLIRDSLLEYDDTRVRETLLERIQNCPSQGIRSDINTEDFAQNPPPFF